MVSIEDVARAAGVSPATVSRALSGRGNVSVGTRERVLEVAAQLNYVVQAAASSLASGRTRNIGVLVPYLDRWFFSSVLAGITSVLVRRGYDLTLYHLASDAETRATMFGTFLRRQRVDGVIAVTIELGERETAELHRLGKPVIAIGGPHPLLPSVAVDDVGVGHVATAHLIELGHRRIAFVGGEAPTHSDFHMPADRRVGYSLALTDAGLEVDPTLSVDADFTMRGGYLAAQALLARGDRPTALVAASDEMAIGAILAARDLDLGVPADVSIIGIDGHEMGELMGLTTIDQGARAQGAIAATVILDQLEDEADPESVRHHPFTLVTRSSTRGI